MAKCGHARTAPSCSAQRRTVVLLGQKKCTWMNVKQGRGGNEWLQQDPWCNTWPDLPLVPGWIFLWRKWMKFKCKKLFKVTPDCAFVSLMALGASISVSILKSKQWFCQWQAKHLCNLCHCQQEASGSPNAGGLQSYVCNMINKPLLRFYKRSYDLKKKEDTAANNTAEASPSDISCVIVQLSVGKMTVLTDRNPWPLCY